MVVLCIYAWWHNRKTEEGYFDLSLLFAATLLSIAIQSIIGYNFEPIEQGQGALITIAYHAKETILNPFEIVRWLSAISMAFGPAIWIAVFHYRKTGHYDNRKEIYS